VKKKTLLAVVSLTTLLGSIILSTLFFKTTKANPIVENTFNEPPKMTIKSPTNNETFSHNDVLLAFTLTKPEGDVWINDDSVWVQYNWTDLRNEVAYINIDLDRENHRSVQVNSQLTSPFTYSLNLTDLQDGAHSVQLHAFCDGVVLEMHGLWERFISYELQSDIINFTVDATPPTIIITSIENKPYGDSDVPLNFILNEPASQLVYSLDSQKNITIAGNLPLTGLSVGAHNITIYAWDAAGNIGKSETVNFTITEPFPTALLVGSIILVVGIGLGFLVYRKKRQRNKSP